MNTSNDVEPAGGTAGSFDTAITRMLGIRFPIIAAPMFLVSNADMLVAVGDAGATGAMPSLNARTADAFRETLENIRGRTTTPYGVNIILWNNPRLEEDLKICLELQVPYLITSMGDPTQVVKLAHERGMLVFADVIGMRHAEKAVKAGVDAIIAVCSGAGGHAGLLSPFALIPWLVKEVPVPIIAAGNIVNGQTMAAAMALGASAAYVGTRFIATPESPAPDGFKQMILDASPEDIEYTPEVSGHPASFLKASLERFRQGQPEGEPPSLAGAKAWKDVWSAGQGSGLINQVKPCAQVVQEFVDEYRTCTASL